jgi:lipoprotein-anchoring transpeptidase ErfK/SrfK
MRTNMRKHPSTFRKPQLAVAAALASIIGATTTAVARETVPIDPTFQAGTIVIRTSERRLYLVLGNGTALRYRVAVGRPGKQWFGRVAIDGKYRSPAWTPPPDMRKGSGAPIIPGGSPSNPMGAAALTLAGDRYAIHGTNRPSSIGTFASAGCVRMLNEDVLDLFEKVSIGTPVVVQR